MEDLIARRRVVLEERIAEIDALGRQVQEFGTPFLLVSAYSLLRESSWSAARTDANDVPFYHCSLLRLQVSDRLWLEVRRRRKREDIIITIPETATITTRLRKGGRRSRIPCRICRFLSILSCP
jgi:hypothetical protein